MRRALLPLTLLVLALPARAQEAPGAPTAPLRRPGEDLLMGLAGYTAGAFAATAVSVGLDRAGAPTEVAVPVVLAAYAAGVAGGVYGTGRLLGLDGSFRNTLGDAVSGMFVGAAVGGTILVLAARAHDGDPVGSEEEFFDRLGEALGYAFLALGATALTPVVWAVADFRVAPAAFRAPDGEAAPGVALLLRF